MIDFKCFTEKQKKRMENIEKISNKSAIEMVYGWYDFNIFMASVGMIDEKDWAMLETCKHARMGRGVDEFAIDIILGWLEEDVIMHFMRKKGKDFELSGTDSHRQFSFNKNIRTTSDFISKSDKKITFIELSSDHTGFVKKNGKLDLRDNKLTNMIKEELDTFVCIIDWKHLMYGFIKVDNSTTFKEEYNPRWNKMCKYIEVDYEKTFKRMVTA